MKIITNIGGFGTFGKLKFFHGIAVLLFSLNSFSLLAQLPPFTLNVTHTEETCAGNASLNFTSQNTDPLATVTYAVYLLPDTVTAIAVLTTNLLEGLTAGTYQVVATQLLNGASNIQTQNVTISNQTIPLAYTTSSTNVTCGNNGTMTVSVFSGTATLYEIISGPVIMPPQSSPFFNQLSAGVYQIRVFDSCGEGWVTTHTLFSQLGGIDLNSTPESTQLLTCDTVSITNTLTPSINTALTYPINVVYTIFPPGAPPIVTNITLASGDITSQEFTTVVPYGDAPYTYNISVVDACGNNYNYDSVLINAPYLGTVRATPAECGNYYLTYIMDNFMAPLTINFLSSPPGFNPIDFNPAHPGPFTPASNSYGDSNNGVPFGFYSAQITDACGRTLIIDTTLQWTEPTPTVNIQAYDGCQSDMSEVSILLIGYKFLTAFITAGPAIFSSTYPVDVSTSIDPLLGQLKLEFIPTGTYTIIITDDCGNIHEVLVDVPPLATTVAFSTRTGCEYGTGAIRIRGNSTQLQSVSITSAPAAYAETLPYDVSFNINTASPSVFSMNGLPPGTYILDAVDNCGVSHQVTVNVVGYAVTLNTYNVIPHCGSFDLDFSHESNASTAEAYWLQKRDPATNTWGHPETGVPYTALSPSSIDSYMLIPNTINYNISYLGDFRIIKSYESFENGSIDLFKMCVEVIQEFTFINTLEITDIQKITCNGLNSDVLITAEGFPPLTYQITTKNGFPFLVDNGSNNVFVNLESAVYNFLVFDTCGNIVNRLTDVALLPSLINIPQPAPGQIDIVHCDDSPIDGQSLFNLTSRNLSILGSLPIASYNITYHTTPEEATAGINPLPENYTSGTALIYARIEYNNRDDCFDTVSFNIIVNDYPTLQMETARVICDGETITLTADSGFLSYLWSTGETTSEISVSVPGLYTLEVTQMQNGLICTAIYTVQVTASEPATIYNIDTVDWTFDQNSISVFLEENGLGDYTFSIDGINYQSANTFYGLPTGMYTVYIKDTYGCRSVEQQVTLLGYPKFFTPNKDGYNDFWHVFYASTEPNIKVSVFDRYGKLLTSFGADSPGWDGFYNGKEMPSTDYWFKVIREDGTEHTGHFAMKR